MVRDICFRLVMFRRQNFLGLRVVSRSSGPYFDPERRPFECKRLRKTAASIFSLPRVRFEAENGVMGAAEHILAARLDKLIVSLTLPSR